MFNVAFVQSPFSPPSRRQIKTMKFRLVLCQRLVIVFLHLKSLSALFLITGMVVSLLCLPQMSRVLSALPIKPKILFCLAAVFCTDTTILFPYARVETPFERHADFLGSIIPSVFRPHREHNAICLKSWSNLTAALLLYLLLRASLRWKFRMCFHTLVHCSRSVHA